MDPLTGVRILIVGSAPALDAAQQLIVLLGGEAIVAPAGSWTMPAGVEVDGAITDEALPADLRFPAVRTCADGDSESFVARGLAGLMEPPIAPVGDFGPRLVAAAALVRLMAAARGRMVDIDALGLLGERAALASLSSATRSAAGDSATMVRANDGWVALNLARPDDIDLLPALVGAAVDSADWTVVAEAIARIEVDQLVERATLLGLPLAPVGRHDDAQLAARGQQPVGAPFLIDGRRPGRSALRPSAYEVLPAPVGDPLVVELASLWAGPLTGRILTQAGCRVVKVEGVSRPDGTRRGPAAFFDLLNAGKESVALDFTDAADVDLLGRLLDVADVVIEGSRPRVLDGLGLGPDRPGRPHRVWLSITGYGRTGPWSNRVAFGDDAAVAGGLHWGDDPPQFVLDAAADPIAGLYGAVGALAGLISGRGHTIDVSMREAVGYAVGPAGLVWDEAPDVISMLAVPTVVDGAGPALGANHDEWSSTLS